MFILFSPSETKQSGGTSTFAQHHQQLIGGAEIRTQLIQEYETALTGTEEQRIKLTGWKDLDNIEQLPTNLHNAPVLPAIERYTGVGYQYLNFQTLDTQEKTFILNKVVIFSNLFGPVRASDMIPETKLKQTKKLGDINIAKHYNQHTSEMLDTLIGDQPVLDLRAGAYKTFYKPKTQTIECVFLKNGKTVNHWSKAYRGTLLRHVAQHKINTLEELMTLDMNELKLAKQDSNTLTYQIQ